MSLLPSLYIIRRNDGAVLAWVPVGMGETYEYVHFEPDSGLDLCVWTSRKKAEDVMLNVGLDGFTFMKEGATYEVVELAEALVVH